jgi:acyl carrier protein
MKTEQELKQALRDWIVATSGKISPEELTNDTPIIEQRIITSLQVMDLILLVEKLRNDSIDVETLKPGVFHDVNTIYNNFLKNNSHEN